jgi:hypothetical protein
MSLIKEAFIQMIRHQDRLDQERHELLSRGEPKRIWVSELGRCPRKPFLEVVGT